MELTLYTLSQVDFFATFADILNYPLPGGDYCTYAYDSDSPNLQKSAKKLGRPKWPEYGNLNSYMKYLTGQSTAVKYSAEVQLRNSQGISQYLTEAQVTGLGRAELWKTKEDRTGFLVGTLFFFYLFFSFFICFFSFFIFFFSFFIFFILFFSFLFSYLIFELICFFSFIFLPVFVLFFIYFSLSSFLFVFFKSVFLICYFLSFCLNFF